MTISGNTSRTPSPVQSRALSARTLPLYQEQSSVQQTSPTNNSDAKYRLNLEKAYALGRGFGNMKPNASREELEQGFQSFMQKIPQPDTPTQAGYSVGKHSTTESTQKYSQSVAQKTTTQSKIPLNDRLEAYSPGAYTSIILKVIRNRFEHHKRDKYTQAETIKSLQANLLVKALKNLLKIMNNNKNGNILIDADYRKECIQEAINTHPNNAESITEDSKPAAKKRKL